jgi:outer membrane protein OmpA-like peptidoglycan-associated protein
MSFHGFRMLVLAPLLAAGCATDGTTEIVHTRTVYVQPAPPPVKVTVPDPVARANARASARAAEAATAQANAAAQQARLATEEARLANERAQQASDRAANEAAARQSAERDAVEARAEAARADAARAERDEALAALRAFATVNDTERGLVITVPAEVMFRVGSDQLLPRAREKLDSIVDALDDLEPTQSLVIEGHTDSSGSSVYNRELSERRALAVRAYLVSQGVGAERIIALGRGEDEPVASNAGAEGRANNRRVEIVVSPAAVSRR